jgi:hypothetical protein
VLSGATFSAAILAAVSLREKNDMAAQTQIRESRKSSKRAAASRNRGNGAARARRRSTARARSRNAEIGELERMIRSLEDRIVNLTSAQSIRSTVSGATDQVSEAVSRASGHVGDIAAEMLTDVASRLRGSATSVTGVARIGTQAMQKVGSELERRPIMTVAIALGLGFLAGLAGRRSEQAR